MDVPRRRERTIVEAVIDVPSEGIMADEYEKSVSLIMQRMTAEGVKLGYGNSYRVRVNDEEIIFEYEPKDPQ